MTAGRERARGGGALFARAVAVCALLALVALLAIEGGCAHSAAVVAPEPGAAAASAPDGGWSETEATRARAASSRAREEATRLLEQLRAAHRIPETLSAEAKAFVDAAEGGGRYGLLIAISRPSSLRIDALTPWGEPAASLVAHQGKFFLRDQRNGVFLRGSSSPKNLARLLPAPLRDDELIALLCGAPPELPGAEALRIEDASDGLRRLILSTLPDPAALTLRGFSQEILIGQDLRVLEVKRLIAGGKPLLLWTATLDEHDDKSGAQVPRLLHLHVPKATSGEAKDLEIDLRIKNAVTGKPPPPAAFTLVPPPGMRVEELP